MSAALLDHLWQSTLCVGIAAILAWACRNAGAHVRYGIWLAASLKFLVPLSLLAVLGSYIRWGSPSELAAYVSSVHAIAAPASASASPAQAPSQMVTYASTPGSRALLGNWLLAAWIIGSAALAARWLLRWNVARRIVASATPAAFEAPLAVRVTANRIEPGVFGILRPTLLLPENIFQSLQPHQLQALVAHEAAHVDRRDNLTAALHSATAILFWFHPLVWWIGTRLVEERERACDEAVIRAGNDRHAYAHTILSVCRLYLGAPIVSASGASRGHLQTRIEAIMDETISAPLSNIKRGLLAAAAAAVLVAPIAFGIVNPARAQAAAEAPATPALRFAAVQIQRGDDSPQTVIVDQDAFSVRNATVSDLVRYAYGRGLPPKVSGGPGWLDTERYTIQAKLARVAETGDDVVSEPSSPEISRSMPDLVRKLLEEQFHLRARVTKSAVYILESAPDAPGASQKPVEKGIGLIDQKSGKVTFRGASSASVAEALSTFLSSQVLDHTRAGVTYDFKMKWPRNDLKALGDQLHERAGLILKSFTMEQLTIEGAERPTLSPTAPAADQIAAR